MENQNNMHMETELKNSDLSEQIKAVTKDSHVRAENTELMLSYQRGHISLAQYKLLLCSLYEVYLALEEELDRNSEHPCVAPIYFPSELARLEALKRDLEFFYGKDWKDMLVVPAATKRYAHRLRQIGKENPEYLVAHAYTRYLGDLSGGQVLGRITQKSLGLKSGEGLAFFSFPGVSSANRFKQLYRGRMNSVELKEEERRGVLEEAVLAFEFNIQVFDDLQKMLSVTENDNTLQRHITHSKLANVRSSAPPRGHPSLLSPPILSVTPPSGQVKRGQSMNFLCSLPPGSTATLPQAYVLLKTPRETLGVSEGSLVAPQTLWVSMTQFGSFDLGPVQGGEGGSYICLYQVTIPQKGMANSSLSKPVHVTVTDWLPVPTLSLYYQGDKWHLVCTGSPAFPGVQFSLYHQDSARPDSTQQVPITRHHAVFPLPASQPGPPALYQCQYTARLGSDWIQSDRSLSLEVPTNTGEPVVDWPLVLGCLSAVVLFSVSLATMAIAMHRRVKSMAEERRKREQSMFWSKLHARDHVVDLTLKSSSFTSLDWANSGNTPESLSQPYHWQDMTSFHSPPT